MRDFVKHFTCADLESFVRRGPILTCFFSLFFLFLADEERKDSKTAKSRPSSARQRNAI